MLQLLLEEGVHIRDMRSIIECMAEHAATVTDPVELARRIRTHIAPAIVQQIYGSVKELDVIALEPDLERLRHPGAHLEFHRTAPRWTPAWPTPWPQRRRDHPVPRDLGVPPACWSPT